MKNYFNKNRAMKKELQVIHIMLIVLLIVLTSTFAFFKTEDMQPRFAIEEKVVHTPAQYVPGYWVPASDKTAYDFVRVETE